VKRYRFRLESVLRARRAQEELARQELARANLRLRAAAERRHAEEERYRQLAARPARSDRTGFLEDRAGADLAAATLNRAQRSAEDMAVAAAVRHAAWRETAQRVAALERLDERRREEHGREVQRAEVNEIDDMTSARWARDAMSEPSRPLAVTP
jgi:flagellar protein FliJ